MGLQVERMWSFSDAYRKKVRPRLDSGSEENCEILYLFMIVRESQMGLPVERMRSKSLFIFIRKARSLLSQIKRVWLRGRSLLFYIFGVYFSNHPT